MAEKFGLQENDLKEIIAVFEKFSEIESVILYGSRAIGTFKTGSDIDLALKGKINLDILAKVKRILDEELTLPYFFDVTDYNSITNLELKQHIDQFGKVLYFRKEP